MRTRAHARRWWGTGAALVAALLAASACDADLEIGSNRRPTSTGSGTGGGATSSGSSTASTSSGVVPPGCEGGAVGVFEAITPPGVDLAATVNSYGARAVSVDPVDPAIVYAGFDFQGIWKSADCGTTWSKLSTGLHGDVFESGFTWTITIDPKSPQTFYATSGQGALGLWKSTNGGVDWAQLFGPGNITEAVNPFSSSPDLLSIAIDPDDSNHLVVSFHGSWKGSNDAGFVVSNDGGATWELRPPPPGIGINHAVGFVGASSRWIAVSDSTGAWLTTDGGTTFTKVDDDYHASGSTQIYRSADGTYYHGGTKGVARSPDGLTWSVVPGGGNVQGIVGDGARLYTSDAVAVMGQFYGAPYLPYRAAPETPGDTGFAVWGAQMFDNGANQLAVDRQHHWIYASAWRVGLLRARTD